MTLIVALEFGENEDELKRKELGPTDKSIKKAHDHHVLVGPDVWEFTNEVSLEVR
jgi:hypothetical protein